MKDYQLAAGSNFDQEQAQKVVKFIFDSYDSDGTSILTAKEIGNLIVDTYKIVNKTVTPNLSDINEYFKFVDKNNNQKITKEDFQDIAQKYLINFKLEKI